MVARDVGGMGRDRENSARYERWNYLQARPISYQKAIKSFRDLEITSTPDQLLSPGNDPSLFPVTLLFPPTRISRSPPERCVRFFPSISSPFLLTARHRVKEEEDHFRHPTLKRSRRKLFPLRPRKSSVLFLARSSWFPFPKAFDSIGWLRHDREDNEAIFWTCTDRL